jgi:exonuclease SbcD
MRLLHTADWHLGRRLKGVDRTPELETALNELLDSAIALEVDAMLIAGDIFEVPNPPAEAERVAYRFFQRLQAAKIPAVLIAGNHDSASRIDGLAGLLALAGIDALGRPRAAHKGGVITLETRGGKLCVGALPFASERRLLSAEELWELDDQEQRRHYREAITQILRTLTNGFDHSGVNVLMAHMAIDSAKLAHSEAAFYTRDAYALSENTLPGAAQYIALGHIHTPQVIQAAAPTRYAGSLIQLDFGEAGEQKGFQLIELEAGRPARMEFKPLNCHNPLLTLHCHAGNLDEQLEAHKEHPGYLKVIVTLDTPLVGLAERVRKICKQALVIEPRYPEREAAASTALDPNTTSPQEAYRRYYRDRLGNAPSSNVMNAFTSLYEELSDATA